MMNTWKQLVAQGMPLKKVETKPEETERIPLYTVKEKWWQCKACLLRLALIIVGGSLLILLIL